MINELLVNEVFITLGISGGSVYRNTEPISNIFKYRDPATQGQLSLPSLRGQYQLRLGRQRKAGMVHSVSG